MACHVLEPSGLQFEAFYSSRTSIKDPTLIPSSCAPVRATDPGWTCCSVQMWWRWRGGGWGGGGDNTRGNLLANLSQKGRPAARGNYLFRPPRRVAVRMASNALKKTGLMGEGLCRLVGCWVLNCAHVNSPTVVCLLVLHWNLSKGTERLSPSPEVMLVKSGDLYL